MRRLVALVVTLVATFACASPAGAFVWITWPNNNPTSDPYFGVVTNSGVYWIARQCYNEAPSPARTQGDMGAFGNQVGPGYIFAAAANDTDGWRTKARDYLDVSQSDPRSGGWAKFGLHVARKDAAGNRILYVERAPNGTTASTYVKELQTGICRPGASGSTDQGEIKDPFYYGGVSHWQVLFGPEADGNVGRFVIEVFLHDGFNDVARVVYDYRIWDTHVQLYAHVQPLCPGTECSGHSVYVKEPKYTVSDYGLNCPDPANPNNCPDPTWLPYNYLLGTTPIGDGSPYACWDASTTIYRIYAPAARRGQTLDCADYTKKPNSWLYREQVWFKYNDGVTPDLQRDCPRRCTWVQAKGTNTAAAIDRWTGQGLGLDQWAVEAAGRPRYKDWTTNDPAYCQSHASNFADMRQWEIGGARPGITDPTQSGDASAVLQTAFHGWTGGTGPTDCLNLLRQIGSKALYSNYFEFRFQ